MKKLKFIAKFSVSIVLIVILFHKIDIRKFEDMLFKIGLFKFFILSMLYILSQVISSLRWSLVIRSLNERMHVLELLRAYFLGMYANLFLPSIIGGDAVKAYIVSRKIGLRKSISSIFLERYNGLLALLAISCISVLLFGNFFNGKIIMAVVFVNIFSVVSIYSLRFSIFQRYEKLRNFYKDIAAFHKSRFFLQVSFFSFIVQALVITIYILAGNMLGIKISPIYYLVFIPIINLISFLPISFNGIGVREFSFVYFFAFAKLSKLQALSLSISVFFVVVFCSIIGGIIYFVSKDRTVEEAEEFYKTK